MSLSVLSAESCELKAATFRPSTVMSAFVKSRHSLASPGSSESGRKTCGSIKENEASSITPSSLQRELHPSPDVVFPSSQTSPASSCPFPHSGSTHAPLKHVPSSPPSVQPIP